MLRTPRHRKQSSLRHASDKRGGRIKPRELRKLEIRRKNRGAIIAISAVFLAFLGGGAFYYFQPEIEVDEDTLCLKDQYPEGHTVFLIDGTDRLPRSDIRYLKGMIKDEQRRLGVHHKLSLYRLTENAEEDDFLTQMFGLCNPGQADQYNQITDSLRVRQAIWDKKFGTPLSQRLEEFVELPEANTTALLEAISELSNEHDFQGKNVSKRKLVIVSDMLHHTPEFSQYSSNYSIDSFKDIAAYRNSLPILDGIEVVIHYVNRRKTYNQQGADHRLFWTELFEWRGASSVTFDPEIR